MADASADETGSRQVRLDATAYEQLRRATETYREELLVRLGGEVGLRTAEMARIRPGDIRRYRDDHHFLGVRDADDEPTREAYLPADVADALRKYARQDDRRAGERLFDVSARRIQMLISTVAERAADRTGDRQFEAVTSRDLRRYFARHLLVEARVDPRVVMAVGGWSGVESLRASLGEPDAETIVAEFERVARFGEIPDGPDPRRLENALDAAGHAVYVVGPDGQFEYVNGTFEAVTGHSASEVVGRSPGQLLTGTGGSPAAVWRAVGRGDVWEGPLDFRHADGGSVRLATTVAPLTDDGDLAGYVGVGRPTDAAGRGGDHGVTERVEEVTGGVRELGRSLTECSEREGIETTVCRHLTGIDSYEVAWIARRRPDGELVVGSRAGGDADSPAAIADDEAAADVIRDSIRTREPLFAQVGELPGAWGEPGVETVGCVPVVGDHTRSAIVVFVDRPELPEWERRLLTDLGHRVEQAVAAVQRRKLLVADTVLELEFVVADERAVLVALAGTCECTFQLEGLVPVAEESMLYFLRSSGAVPRQVVETAASMEPVADARIVRDHAGESLFELVVTGDSPATTLVGQGGRVQEMTVDDRAVIVAAFPRDTDVRTVVEGLARAFPDSDLRAKRERERPVDTAEGFRERLTDRLTDKQHNTLRAAYLAGYFEWPRGTTAEELADSMGVSSPTLHNHLRRAQQKLLTAFFDEQSGLNS